MSFGWRYVALISTILVQASKPVADAPVRLVTQTASTAAWQVDVTKDGRWALTLENKAIRVWDVESGREWRWLRGTDEFSKFRLHKFANLVAAFGTFELTIFDIELGTVRRRCPLSGPDHIRSTSMFTMAASPVSTEMLIAMNQGFGIVDIANCRVSNHRRLGGTVRGLAWAPDGLGIIAAVEEANDKGRLEYWRKGEGKPRQSLPFKSSIENLSVTSGGRIAAGCLDGTVVVLHFEPTTLITEKSIPSTDPVGTVRWLDDGKRVLIRLFDDIPRSALTVPTRGRIRILDVETAAVQDFKLGTFFWDAVMFPGDERIVAAGPDRTVLVDVASGTIQKTLQGTAQAVHSVAFLRDGSGLAVGLADGSARVWGPSGTSEVHQPKLPNNARPEGAIVSHGSEVLVLGQVQAYSWNWMRPEIVATRLLSRAVWDEVAWSEDRGRVLYRRANGSAEVLESSTGKVLCSVKGDTFHNAAALSPDGRTLVFFSSDQGGLATTAFGLMDRRYLASIRDVQTCSETGIAFGDDTTTEAGFSEDGKWLYSTDREKIHVWSYPINQREPNARFIFPRPASRFVTVRVSPNGKTLAALDETGELLLWSLETGKPQAPIAADRGGARYLDFSPDNRFIAVASSDGTIKLYSLERRREVATLTSLVDGGWTVVDPDGRYDASDPDHSNGLHWVIGRQVVEIGQLPARRFWVSNLLGAILSGQTLPDVGGRLGQLGEPPTVTVAPLKKGDQTLHLMLINNGGGLGPVVVRVNNRQLPGTFQPLDRTAKTAPLDIPLQGAVLKTAGDDDIDVVAYAASDGIAAQPRGVKARAPAAMTPAGDPKTQVYALFIGTSKYRNPSLELTFSSADAIAMREAVRLGAERLFPNGRVHLSLLSSEDGNPLNHPTKATITREFAKIAKDAKPEDTVVVYFAGHGVALGNQFYYLTGEATSLEETDEKSRQDNTISSTELQRWLQVDVRALKQVVILDTCAAGAAARDLDALTTKRALSPDQLRVLRLLNQATGSFVLMGSAADRVSYESSEYGQGLLTYALLSAMSGEAMPEGQELWVDSWLNYAEREVPQLALGIGGVQQPRLIRPSGHDFPLMMLTAADKRAIPLAQARQRLVRPQVYLEDSSDVVDVKTALRERLKQLAGPATRGGTGTATGRIVYLDNGSGEIPRTLEPRVQCKKTATGLDATVRIVREGQVVGEPSVVHLPTNPQAAAEALATVIVDMCLKAAQNPVKGK